MHNYPKYLILFTCFVFIIAISCEKDSNELTWPRKLNQPSTLTNKIWTQDTLNSQGTYKFIEFYAEPQNVIKFTRTNGSAYTKYNWSYYAEQKIIATNNEALFTYYDCIISNNTLTMTINEVSYVFINYP